jgi:hypothetical protein
VAKLWRRARAVTALPTPAARRAAWQARWTALALIGRSGARPGKSQSVGRTARQVLAQHRQQPGREHDVAVLAPLALADADHHAGAVDIRDAQGRDLRVPQPGGGGGFVASSAERP